VRFANLPGRRTGVKIVAEHTVTISGTDEATSKPATMAEIAERAGVA
jgi:hypothetical protein